MRPAAKNPHVSFEVEGKQQLIPPNGAASCTAGFAYESVIGQGIAELAPEEKKRRFSEKAAGALPNSVSVIFTGTS